MKKIISEADKTDLPLDRKKSAAKTPAQTKTTKSKISVISAKKTSSAPNRSGEESKTQTSKTATKPTSKTPAKSTSKAAGTTIKRISTQSSNKTASKAQAEKKQTAEANKQPDLRSKLKTNSVENMELEKLNEENIKKRGYRGKRNGFIIIILSVLLAISIAVVAFLIGFRKTEHNCFLTVKGDASAVYLIDGEEMSEFKTPQQIQANRVFRIDVDLKIESSGAYYVEFAVELYKGSLLLHGVQLLSVDNLTFELAADGMTYRSRGVVMGNQTLQLFTGIAIDSPNAEGLNDTNFKMEVVTTFRKA